MDGPGNSVSGNDWPFEDPRNLAVFTLWEVLRRERPILHVTHDHDGYWQFLDGFDVNDRKPALVALEEIWKRDPSIEQLSEMPRGWQAYRSTVDDDWQASKLPPEEEDDDQLSGEQSP